MKIRLGFLFVFVALLFSGAPLCAQRPVWVLLKPEAVRKGEIVRGERERAVFDNDRAIPRDVLRQIERTGAHIRYTSRWLQAVSVDANEQTLAKLTKLRMVKEIRPLGNVHAQGISSSHYHITASSHQPTSAFDSAFYGNAWKAIKQLGIAPAHQLGFTGKSVRIAILDTGFEPGHEALSSRIVVAQRDFINKDSNVADEPGDTVVGINQEAHGTLAWSVLGGYSPGKLVGPAYDARFILAKVDLNDTQDSLDFKADEDRWVAAVEWADSNNARIISSSLVYKNFVDKPSYPTSALDGNHSISAIVADEAARRGILVVNAMGNFGPNCSSTCTEPTTLWTPADADSIISVGAVDSTGQPALFANGRSTSRGPTADGQLKPEVSALGKNVYGADANNPTGYTFADGTSVATPLIAGGAAMFIQAWPNLTVFAVRNALILAGNRANTRNNDVGAGVPDISSAILFPEGLQNLFPTGANLTGDTLTTIQPGFTWSAPLVNQQMLPVKYKLEIATDPVFNNVIYSDTVINTTSINLTRPLKPAPAYWYRVVATTQSGVKRATPNEPPIVMPHWVRLLSFPQGGVIDSVRPTFRWEPLFAPPPSGPFTYEVQVITAGSNVVVVRMPNVTTASIQPPDPLAPNISYKYRVIAFAKSGSNVVADTVTSETFIVRSDVAPPTTTLYQNFPNPFPNSALGETSTHIWFDVTSPTTVDLAVYDLHGRLVKRLIPNAPTCGSVLLEPGTYGRGPAEVNPCVTTRWDGTNGSGDRMPRGLYLLRLRAGGTDQVKKILYLP